MDERRVHNCLESLEMNVSTSSDDLSILPHRHPESGPILHNVTATKISLWTPSTKLSASENKNSPSCNTSINQSETPT